MSTPDQIPPRVFISYSHDSPEHADRVLALSDRLRKDGIDCILDQYELSPPEGWPRWMDRHICDADFVLMLCTETYYRRVMGKEKPGIGRGVRWEGNLIYQHIYDDDSINSRFIPVLFDSGQLDHMPKPLKGATHYRLDTDDGYELLYRRLTDQPAVEKPKLGQLRSLPPRNRKQDFFAPPWNVPFERNPFFTGREQVLQDLRDDLVRDSQAALSQTRAISGLGGVGKTQTAVEYAYRHRDDYTAVLWLRADSPEAITGGLVAMAKTLNLPEQDAQNQTEAVDAARRWLESNEGWLLIFDNADDPSLIEPFRPTGARGHILLTSRAQVFDNLGIAEPVTIDQLPPAKALEFLLKRTGREDCNEAERKAAAKLARELAYLPLALEQAGAYILAARSQFQVYLLSYRAHRLELLERSEPKAGNYPESVVTTWSMNFEQIEKESEASADLLRFCAFLSPNEIPLELIALGASELGPALAAALADAKDDPLLVNAALQPLARYSLIRHDVDANTFAIHRLVQEVLRDRMASEVRKTWAERTVRAIARAFPSPTEFVNWALCQRLLPQARVAATLVEQWDFELPEAGTLLHNAAAYLYHRARYAEAEPFYQQALPINEKALGPDHPEVATTLNNLALLYKDQGKLAEAEPLYQRALEIWEKALGPDHPEVAKALNNLAALYYKQGKLAEAEPLYQQALKITEKALGPDHPEVATTLNNLALLYKDQGKVVEAESCYQRALEIMEKALGPDHPRVATTLNNLASLYQDQGKHVEAESLYQRALEIWEKALGPDHPLVATTLENYADLLRATQRESEADELAAGAVAIRENHARNNPR